MYNQTTPLILAVGENNKSTVQLLLSSSLLLDNRVDVNAKDMVRNYRGCDKT